ncbi:ABC transporter [Phytophthora megakarya]|uniref:ABC transporter n=1 Tax=Phytophthora megakarya TaxID=4795 RepID=A0A225VSJ7_9STRA|nr:ABC transporter [Phytophthora megakarya]
MKAHEESTLQLFRMRSSTSVSHRNNDLRGQAAANNCTDPRLIPDEFKTYWVNLICTHGWKRKSQSTGQRKSYFSKLTECKSDVKVAVVWNEQAQKFMVRVTGCNTQHNHRVGRFVYDNHPYVRRVEEPVILLFVDACSPLVPKRIMQFLRTKTGMNATLRDDHNMVSRMHEEHDEDLAQMITIQTRQMRRWFKAFPEVMLVEATHNTNESRYKLFSFMIHNVYGHGHAFKFCHPSRGQIRVIVIDKGMGELSLLEEHFPNAKVILCHFHLKKSIRSEMAKGEHGGPGNFDLDQVEDAVDMIRTASTIEDSTKYFKYLYFLLDNVYLRENDPIPDPKHPFLK